MTKKILVVDDEPETVRSLQMCLEQSGYQVVTACDGLQALSQACTEAPDLVVMDVTMPVMTGFEALQQLKADTSTAYIPVMLLTADHSTGSMAIGYEAGSSLYLTKPFRVKELVKQVRSVLRDCGKRSAAIEAQ